jgi:hypothetical protein
VDGEIKVNQGESKRKKNTRMIVPLDQEDPGAGGIDFANGAADFFQLGGRKRFAYFSGI